VQMASLARFVKSVASITERLDRDALAALVAPAEDVPPAAPKPTSPMRLRVVH